MITFPPGQYHVNTLKTYMWPRFCQAGITGDQEGADVCPFEWRELPLAAAVLACLATAPRDAGADTIIQYQFSPDATLTLSEPHGAPGVVEQLSGGFTFDATTGLLIAANINTTGTADTSPGGFTDVHPVCEQSSATVICVEDDATLRALFINFESSLSLAATDPIAPSSLYLAQEGPGAFGIENPVSSATGSADPVPEPADIALFGSALFGLGAARLRKRKAA
jgi:hypothetical protein